MLYKSYYQSKVGRLTIIFDQDYLYEIQMENQNNPDYPINDNLEIILKVKLWLDKYFNNEEVASIDIPINPIGTTFQKQVWDLLLQIPYGQTTTYGQLAKEIAKIRNKESMSAQAVGGAVGKNPISIFIPCHRVIGKQNDLVGFGGGLDRKVKLLEIEKHKIKDQKVIK